MKRGVIIFIAVLVLVGIIFTVLSLLRNKNVAPQNNTVTVWLPFDEVSTYNQISQAFIKANPTVALDVKYIQAKDSQSYEAQVVNAIANGNGPDVWMVRNDWIPKHIDKSAPAFSAAKGSDPVVTLKQNIIDSVVDANTFNGKLYGLPMSADTLAVIYNADFYNAYVGAATNDQQKAALAKMATTWNDLKLQVEAVSKVSGATISRSGLAIGTASNTFGSVDVLSAFLAESGATVLSDDKKSVAFNLAVTSTDGAIFPATNTLDYYTSFAKSSSPNYSWNTTLGDPIVAFLNQKTGAIIGYYSTLQQIMAQNPKFSIQVAPLVQASDSAVKSRTDYGNSWSLVVNKNSANTAVDWSYLSYLSNRDVQDQYVQATGRLPITRSTTQPTLDQVLTTASRAAAVFETQLWTMKSLYKPEWQQVNQILEDTVNLVISSGQSPQTSVDTAASRFKVFVSP